jgi:hypothetical protein
MHRDLVRFVLVPSVLVPGFDLRFAEVEGIGDVASVGHRQVLLAAEFALEVGELRMREGGASSARLARRLLHRLRRWRRRARRTATQRQAQRVLQQRRHRSLVLRHPGTLAPRVT